MEDMWDIQATKEVRKMRAMKDMRHRKVVRDVYGAKAQEVYYVYGGYEGHNCV